MRSPLEIRCQRELEAEGYLVDRKARHRRTAKGYWVDFLGAFDILAYRPGELRLISVNTQSNGVRRRQRELIESLELPLGNTKEIWTCLRNETVRKERA